MLHIKVNGMTILPMRPDSPVKTFGSEDVPHGTQSVLYRAIQVHNSNGGTPRIGLPSFTEEELNVHKELFAETVEVLPLFDEEGNEISYETLEPNQILEIDEITVKKEFYSNFSEEVPAEELTPRTVRAEDPMMGQEVQAYVDLAACKEALTATAISECAQRLLDRAVEECLIVPELSEEFKAQFELIEVEEI
jgi:hypothetical protein